MGRIIPYIMENKKMFETNTLYLFVRRAVLGLRLPSFETTNQIAIYSLPSAYKTSRNSHPGHPGDTPFPSCSFPFPSWAARHPTFLSFRHCSWLGPQNDHPIQAGDLAICINSLAKLYSQA